MVIEARTSLAIENFHLIDGQLTYCRVLLGLTSHDWLLLLVLVEVGGEMGESLVAELDRGWGRL